MEWPHGRRLSRPNPVPACDRRNRPRQEQPPRLSRSRRRRRGWHCRRDARGSCTRAGEARCRRAARGSGQLAEREAAPTHVPDAHRRGPRRSSSAGRSAPHQRGRRALSEQDRNRYPRSAARRERRSGSRGLDARGQGVREPGPGGLRAHPARRLAQAGEPARHPRGQSERHRPDAGRPAACPRAGQRLEGGRGGGAVLEGVAARRAVPRLRGEPRRVGGCGRAQRTAELCRSQAEWTRHARGAVPRQRHLHRPERREWTHPQARHPARRARRSVPVPVHPARHPVRRLVHLGCLPGPARRPGKRLPDRSGRVACGPKWRRAQALHQVRVDAAPAVHRARPRRVVSR